MVPERPSLGSPEDPTPTSTYWVWSLSLPATDRSHKSSDPFRRRPEREGGRSPLSMSDRSGRMTGAGRLPPVDRYGEGRGDVGETPTSPSRQETTRMCISPRPTQYSPLSFCLEVFRSSVVEREQTVTGISRGKRVVLRYPSSPLRTSSYTHEDQRSKGLGV